jgi:hypothetical protein
MPPWRQQCSIDAVQSGPHLNPRTPARYLLATPSDMARHLHQYGLLLAWRA